eukprot:5371775-Amphidinium_carterae.1
MLWRYEDWKAKLLERVPMNRLGTPEEVADTVLFLVSPEVRHVVHGRVCVYLGPPPNPPHQKKDKRPKHRSKIGQRLGPPVQSIVCGCVRLKCNVFHITIFDQFCQQLQE